MLFPRKECISIIALINENNKKNEVAPFCKYPRARMFLHVFKLSFCVHKSRCLTVHSRSVVILETENISLSLNNQFRVKSGALHVCNRYKLHSQSEATPHVINETNSFQHVKLTFLTAEIAAFSLRCSALSVRDSVWDAGSGLSVSYKHGSSKTR